MTSDHTTRQLVDAWQLASSELGVRVTAPFAFQCGQCTYKCIAHLPDFGGPNGMVIAAIVPRNCESDRSLWDAAEQEGYYISLISTEVYSAFDPSKFKEALSDWGYFGQAELRPSWVVESD